MGIAGSELGVGVTDADDRSAVVHIFRMTLIFHPASVNEAGHILVAEPRGGAKRFTIGHMRSVRSASLRDFDRDQDCRRKGKPKYGTVGAALCRDISGRVSRRKADPTFKLHERSHPVYFR